MYNVQGRYVASSAEENFMQPPTYTSPTFWSPVSFRGKVLVGKDKTTGNKNYVCRAAQSNGSTVLHPGKHLVPDTCHIGYGGNEIVSKTNVEYLYGNYAWKPSSQAATCDKIESGREGDNTLQVCRAKYPSSGTLSSWHSGKTWNGYDQCNIGWGGKEHAVPRFEYLCTK